MLGVLGLATNRDLAVLPWDYVVFWHWLALGLLLLALEIVLPGAVIMWFGAAAIIVGVVLFFAPALSLEIQFLVFAAVAIATLWMGRRYVISKIQPDDHPSLSRRGDQMIGRQFTLDKDTKDGVGRQKVGDGAWRVETLPQGEDAKAGTKMEVVEVDGATLKIRPARGDSVNNG